MESYCYVAFVIEPECNQFRILTLFPGSGDEPLVCTLEHADIGKSPLYEAISYVWGDLHNRKNITCNGRTLSITAGLNTALCHVRSPSESRNLWADAICINQNDNDERGRQVRRMKDIYSRASRVIVWLGEARDESDRGIEVASDIARSCQRYTAEGGALETLTFNDELARRVFGRFRHSSEFPRLRAFAKIIERLWFTRVWVVQEVAVAAHATVLCGTSSISWTDLTNAITAQEHLNLYLADHARNAYVFMLERARMEWCSGIRRSLLSVLFRYRILHSTDPRDKIFGISALTRAELAKVKALQPNYNVETTDLYTAIAKEILGHSTDLNILSVPRRLSGPTTPTLTTSPFPLAGKDQAQVEFGGADSPIIGVRGYCVDRIAAVGTTLMLEYLPRTEFPGVRIAKCAFVLDDWTRVAQLGDRKLYVTGEPMRDAFVQTFACESTSESIETLWAQLDILERNATIAKWFSILPTWLPEWLVDKAVCLFHAIVFYNRNDQMTMDFRIHISSLADRRVFRTEKGYIGLGSALAAVGDEIAVVKGAKVPLILRAKGSKWTLQGDCYLRGIMKGEAYCDDASRRMWIV
ncbi:HET-domain-containing protein [Xylariaceae sp. FL0662B]|nr:HET-domain-containing protein [Xylariaceae sp. FL0662B]